jgi:HlyD family secretion protein
MPTSSKDIMQKQWVVGVGLLAGAALVLAVWMVWRPMPPAPGVLEANGRIEGDQAAVGAKVGGKIVRLTVREGDGLEAGALIAELASDQVAAQLAQAEHTLHTAEERLAEARSRVVSAQRQQEGTELAVTLAERDSRARIGQAEAALGAARAQLRQAEADAERAAKDHTRYRELFAGRAIAAQQLDQAKAADEVARATVEAARKQVSQAEEALELARTSRVAVALRRKEVQIAADHSREAQAAVETAQAQIQTAEAGLLLARANLDDARVTAPFSGTVLKKLVEVGEVTAAGTPFVTLVDLSKLYAKVYVAEGDLGKVKVGDPARVYTDAFPTRYFTAAVAEVSQQAEFTPRDVHMKDERVKLVFAVKLAIQNPQGILKPGMPVDARLRWDPEVPWGDGLE